MSMTPEQFLTEVIDRGLAAARADYSQQDSRTQAKLRGSISGFDDCRGKTPEQILEVLIAARTAANEYIKRDDHPSGTPEHEKELDDYWCARCRELEIEWVANCVSAALMNVGLPTIVPPTARGVMQAAEILGVGGVPSPPLPVV